MEKLDFIHFYEALGVAPGCSLDELKRAYRRRVAQLHPDRREEGADAADLQELTAAYTAATLFQRRYGRLPGAAHDVAHPPSPATATATEHRRTPALVLRAGGGRHLLVTIVVLALLAWLLWANAAAP